MKIPIILFFSLLSGRVMSQEVLHSGGQVSESKNSQTTWTIGETIIFTGESNSVIATQGFNQGYYIITAIESSTFEVSTIKIYPNPTPDKVYIETQNHKTIQNIQITDLNGRELYNANPGTETLVVDLQKFRTESFLINVTSNNQQENFKVLKIK